jgi:hypothetical protein
MATISTTVHKLFVSDITSIVVTDIVEQEDGSFVRAVRFYGDDDAGNKDQLIVEVKVTAATKAGVQIPVPASGF